MQLSVPLRTKKRQVLCPWTPLDAELHQWHVFRVVGLRAGSRHGPLAGTRRRTRSGHHVPAMMRIEIPAANAIDTARSVATAYGELAIGTPRLGIDSETLGALSGPAQDPSLGRYDQVLRLQSRFSLGYCTPWPRFECGSLQAFGTPGVGGSFGFAGRPGRTGLLLRDEPHGLPSCLGPAGPCPARRRARLRASGGLIGQQVASTTSKGSEMKSPMKICAGPLGGGSRYTGE